MLQSSAHQSSPRTTRFAPSPTGVLHLGNLRTFVLNWLIARKRGWRMVMRIEDLDGPRVKVGAEDAIFRIFDWLGLDWDGPVLRQSDHFEPYRHAMALLADSGHAYPCELTRTEIAQAASAPHGSKHDTQFLSELRPKPETFPFQFRDESTNWRLVVPDEAVEFEDEFRGPQLINPSRSVGDFAVWTKKRQPAYQLAVVVDDARQGVTNVIRGDDLLDSAARQFLVYQRLGLAPVPAYCHLPLVVGSDGKRLAKRHGDTRVLRFIEEGVSAERVLGLLAFWSGTQRRRRTLSLSEFVAAFDLTTVPRENIVFTPEDESWLCSK